MSAVSHGVGQPRLLPETLEDRLVGVAAKGFGLVVLVASIAVGASLLTWSAADPSLTHATSGATRNVLGPLGAIVSDLLMQTLGLAGALGLMAPMFWATQLLTRKRISGIRWKLLLALLAVLAFAGALSAIPRLANWPLQHGYGGILGDLGFKVTASLLAGVNSQRAGAAAGLFLFAGGALLLTAALGLSTGDVVTLVTRRDRVLRRRRHWFGTRAIETAPPVAPYDNPFDLVPSRNGHDLRRSQPHSAPANVGPGPVADETSESLEPLRRDEGFEDSTDIESQAMARRFAPPGAVPAPAPAHASPTPKAGNGGGFFAGLVSGARRPEPEYRRPSLNMLRRPAAERSGVAVNQSVLKGQARLLEDTLGDFGVKGEIKDIRPGPVVTLFELEPARGTKSSRVIGLADDIARSMSALAVRVAVVPGRNVIGIELPNAKRDMVYLRELLESDGFRSTEAKLPMVLGKTIGGEPIVADLARMPHLLVAGTTGSGKSVGVNAMILSLLYRLSPDECRMIMIDPKMLELSVYNGIPHLLTPVVTDPHKAVAALNWVVAEMEERYKRMSKLAVRNIDAFNTRLRAAKKRGEPLSRTVQTGFDPKSGQPIHVREDLGLEPMPYIVVVVDEFADLMAVAGKEIEFAVQRLAQMARAAGIHLIMATQRPSVDIITGTIKANFPTRISFKVTSKIDSRTILNEQGAEQLLGQGDMLYAGGIGQVLRVHGPFVSDEEVEAIAKFLRDQGEPRYVAGITDCPELNEPAEGRASEDDLYDRAVAVVLAEKRASTSYLQRRLSIGYNRAADLIERMERDGVVGPPNHAGKRSVVGAEAPPEAAPSPVPPPSPPRDPRRPQHAP